MTRLTTDEAWAVLAEVPDPEIPAISLTDLGIIRDLVWKDDVLEVTVTPTYSGCPATSFINEAIVAALEAAGVARVSLKQQISPPWTSDWLTEEGRRKLEAYGIAPPGVSKGPERCPRCGSTEVERISQFGSTPCKAQWRCKACLEPFDHFKCI
ncbi:MAG: phenylacetate-CoA oxygenase subunit PaaJ [Rhodobacterales bacterium]|nr:MAG: phenylacetate-CoA oxygenase subunit PaaJ [Rhodobacterales bacterium]